MTQLRPAIMMLVILMLVTGGLYPVVTTLLGQWWFPYQSRGSLIEVNGEVRGSELLGQNFTQPKYFQGRPSATGEVPYNPMASGGSNLAGSNPALDKAIRERVEALRAANPQTKGAVPVDLVTASSSGLDNGISPDAALWQIPRVAQARGMSFREVQQVVEENTVTSLVNFIGQPYVNVTRLNQALDALQSK
ncbi:potassium-transporting ATPase subunit KdpC [Klebsiella pneumoniae]|uniref:potassium-transporting ATPase subunit KdpC n=1 Tax=Enterobacteriaceae TaxID=543 RepID=UPI000DA7B5F9|nr:MULTISPECIES: potassium-transporting ATPase subunit KdpC [Enterobacteriaceae]EBV7063899.1 potassium-transporting ATPase subunit KdpC [Salmonella enterica subsp. enterica serovar Ohio]ECM4991009.1 potassium-transporting ATPase subunit KdpC [Salmonella enterica subsp. enterica serovar Montevideo]EDV0840339.1 potassium-transporting ATPase subunit KdpC [Salmonella enterica subsp. enterica serovar Havana]EEA8077451.1 potassium-transporting ATPase subunit KdpC [Salmonella enterica subsp. enterica 